MINDDIMLKGLVFSFPSDFSLIMLFTYGQEFIDNNL